MRIRASEYGFSVTFVMSLARLPGAWRSCKHRQARGSSSVYQMVRVRDRRIARSAVRSESFDQRGAWAMMRSRWILWIRCRKPEGPHTGAATDRQAEVKRASISRRE